MINPKEAPIGFYAEEHNWKNFGSCCSNCDFYKPSRLCEIYNASCTERKRIDGKTVIFKARWWFKPILITMKLIYKLRRKL